MKKKQSISLIWYRNSIGEPHTGSVSMKSLIIAACIILFVIVLSVSLAVVFYLKSERLTAELRNIEDEKSFVPKPSIGEVFTPGREADQQAVSKEGSAPAPAEAKKVEPKKTVAIENMMVAEQEDGKGVNLNFEIVRLDEGGAEKFSGFVIIVGKVDNKYFTIPEGIDVKDGVPAAYIKGDRYGIKHRKKFEKIVRYNPEAIKSLETFVYSETGELLIKQGVKIK